MSKKDDDFSGFNKNMKVITRTNPVEMIISKKAINPQECLRAVRDVAKETWGINHKRYENVSVFRDGSGFLCAFSWTCYGLIILSRVKGNKHCTNLLRLALTSIQELSFDEDNDLELVRLLVGEDLFPEEEEDSSEDLEWV